MFSCDFFETLQDSFFIGLLCMTVFDLGKYLKTLIINYELGKYVTTVPTITDFTENAWNSGVPMKQSDNFI